MIHDLRLHYLRTHSSFYLSKTYFDIKHKFLDKTLLPLQSNDISNSFLVATNLINDSGFIRIIDNQAGRDAAAKWAKICAALTRNIDSQKI